MNDGQSRCPHGFATTPLERPGESGWFDVFAPKECKLCEKGKRLASYGTPVEESEARDDAAPSPAHRRVDESTGLLDGVLGRVAELEHLQAKAADLSRLTERVFKLEARETGRRDPAAEAIEEREVDRAREQVEGGACFVCGQPIGPALGFHEAGVGWRHKDGSEVCQAREPRRLVLIESPHRGGGSRERYADAVLLDCLARGEAPMASHLLYTRVLDDDTPTDRHTGMSAGWAWLGVVSALVVYTDLGISGGMHAGMSRANALELDVEFRTVPGWRTRE